MEWVFLCLYLCLHLCLCLCHNFKFCMIGFCLWLMSIKYWGGYITFFKVDIVLIRDTCNAFTILVVHCVMISVYLYAPLFLMNECWMWMNVYRSLNRFYATTFEVIPQFSLNSMSPLGLFNCHFFICLNYALCSFRMVCEWQSIKNVGGGDAGLKLSQSLTRRVRKISWNQSLDRLASRQIQCNIDIMIIDKILKHVHCNIWK
jgi:hypothetical protein